MKKLILALCMVFVISSSNAQSLDYGNDADAFRICNALSGNNFLSDSAADTALDKILNVIGASKRFVLQSCSNINNAVALSYKGVRYIMYDPNFMRRISSSNDWVNMFILAHEVGHHINGHSVDVLLSDQDIAQVSLSQKRTQELEADEFAGFVLGRLGANLNDALSSVASMSDGDDSYSTHPSKSKRQAAIRKGFNESGGKVDSSRSVEKGEIIDSKYSNSRYSGVKYVVLNDFYDGGVYEGYVAISTNKPFGYGTIKFENGLIVKGEFSNGYLNGYGLIDQGNGYVEEGEYVNSELIRGEKKWPSIGRKQTGSFSNGNLIKGSTTFKEGIIDGTFKEGNIIFGTYISNDGNQKQIGFLDDLDGDGFKVLTNFNGTLKGFFKDGELIPQRGLFVLSDGYTDSDPNLGRFSKFDKKTRKLISDTGKASLLDFFPSIVKRTIEIVEPKIITKWDLEDHVGKTVINIKTKEIKVIPNNYEYGDYEIQNQFDGRWYVGDNLSYAQYNWDKEKHVYRGYFKSGTTEKAGYGELIYGPNDDRKSYSGMWWNDKKSGYGQLTYKDGRVEKGIFIDNEFYKSENFDLALMQKFLKDF